MSHLLNHGRSDAMSMTNRYIASQRPLVRLVDLLHRDARKDQLGAEAFRPVVMSVGTRGLAEGNLVQRLQALNGHAFVIQGRGHEPATACSRKSGCTTNRIPSHVITIYNINTYELSSKLCFGRIIDPCRAESTRNVVQVATRINQLILGSGRQTTPLAHRATARTTRTSKRLAW
jgi:hypothetical protein